MTQVPIIPAPDNTKPICAVMVTYNPDADLSENAAAILSQADHLIVVDNGSSDKRFFNQPPLNTLKCTPIKWPNNRGIAAALNAGISKAQLLGYEWVLLMDQDSKLADGCLAEMVRCWASHPLSTKIAMAGPNYSGPNRLQDAVHSPYEHWPDSATVPELITSGTLMAIALMDIIGPMREEFFIDMVDIEFCWRVRRKGLKMLVAKNAHMQHQLGVTQPIKFLGGVAVHSPFRTYYRSRNAVKLMKEVIFKDPKFFLARLLKFIFLAMKLLFLGRPWLLHMKLLLRGIWHGLRNRMGPAPTP